MNVYLVTTDDELVTPELTGSILEGVTRDSILTLAAEFGLTPVERRIGIAEMLEGIGSGQVTEMFACGTAAVITPIGVAARRRGHLHRRLRRDRRDHRRPAQEPAGHPVRPRRGHPRLAAPRRLTATSGSDRTRPDPGLGSLVKTASMRVDTEHMSFLAVIIA